jgi:hypothetical protein
LNVGKSGVRHKGHIRLKPLLYRNKHQPIHQNLSQYKLTLQASRNYCKKRKIDDAKKTYVCIVVEKITKLEIAL